MQASQQHEYKRGFEFMGAILLVAGASATAFIWFPVAAAISVIAGVGVGLAWGLREIWRWYDAQYPIEVKPLTKLVRRGTPPTDRKPTSPVAPVVPAASLSYGS